MSKFPEWFIGGPYHGKDRAVEIPYDKGNAECITVYDKIEEGYFLYQPVEMVLGLVNFKAWIDTNRTSPDEALQMLSLLLFRPHDKNPDTSLPAKEN